MREPDPVPVFEVLLLVLIFLFGALGCSAGAHPVQDWRERTGIGPDSIALTIEGAERMEPVQEAYGPWAKEMHACLLRLVEGRSWRVSIKAGVRVYTADSIRRGAETGAGIYLWPQSIVVLERHVATEEVVKHELGHIFCPACPHPIIEHCANPEAR